MIRAFLIVMLLQGIAQAETYQQVRDVKGQISTAIIRRVEDGASIPVDPLNRMYREFLEWEKAGNRILPPPEVPGKTPREILKEQAIMDAKNTLLTPTQRLNALIIILDLDLQSSSTTVAIR